ncbi:MAG: phenylalanyl-tRNA synthetase alpha subunit [Ulvibacter sp.]|jgi:phenylalanyl-tRNA synthetase alpha subunit
MKIFFLSLITLFFSVVSCGNPSEEIQTTRENIETTVLFGEKNFVFPNLSENAKVYTMQWGAFEDFEIEAKSINGSTVDGLRAKSTRLINRLDSITKKVPDTLNTKSIISRVMVTKTRALLLLQEVQKTNIDSARLQLQIKEMNNAAKHLIIQINEKFLKDAIDFQRVDSEKKEIESQKRLLDSIFKLEMEDNKSN